MSFENEIDLLKKRSGINEERVDEQAEQRVQQAMAAIQQGLGVLFANREAALQAIQMLGSKPQNKAYAEALTALMQAAGQVQMPG